MKKKKKACERFSVRIDASKFGTILVSHPAGREAYFAAEASLLRGVDSSSEIEVDFSGVLVLTPSWADEFLKPLRKKFPHVHLTHTENVSVQATLKTLQEFV